MKRKNTEISADRNGIETITDIRQLLPILKDYILQICQTENIDSNNIPFSQWRYILFMIGNDFMPGYRYLFRYNGYNNIMQWNRNSIVVSCTNLYIPLCRVFKQKIYLNSFCEFIGINVDTLIHMVDNEKDIYKNNTDNTVDNNTVCDGRQEEISIKFVDLLQYIHVESENSLSDLMQSNKGNQIGFLSELNFRYGWTKPEIQKENKRLQSKQLETLPVLEIETKE